MAKVKMEAGAVLESLTPQELVHHLDRYTQNWFQERARGITVWRFDETDTVVSTAITMPAVGKPTVGPNTGFAVLVQALRVVGLASGDSLTVYRNFASNPNYVATLSFTAPVFKAGSKALVLKGGEKLIFVGASLMATGDITVNGEGIELPEPDLYKLF